MKRLLSFLVTLLATTALWAYDFQSGKLYYNILSESTVEVTYQVYSYSGSSNNYAGLTSVTIPASVTNDGKTYKVTSIGKYTFNECTSLTSVDIPGSVTSIGQQAFWKCKSLTSVTLHNGLTSIERSAFGYCYALTSIDVPASVKSIGQSVFSNCKKLTSVTLHEGLTSIGSSAFSSCESLVSITIPESVTSMDVAVFSRSPKLTSVALPKHLTSITNSMFGECTSLTSIVIPESVTSIGEMAFTVCGLTSITIPKNVTSIGYCAFSYIKSFTSIYVEAQTPPVCDKTCFDGVPTDFPVYVPCGAKKAYQDSAVWSAFTNIIEGPVYTATVLSSNKNYGTATVVSNTCADGLTVKATATKEHYHFVRWSDGSTQNPYTLVLTKDTTLTAEFAQDEHTVTATAEHGIVTGSGTYTHGTEVTLTATADEHYHFVRWSDGNTDNPRTISVTKDSTFTAEFAQDPVAVSVYDDCNKSGKTYDFRPATGTENGHTWVDLGLPSGLQWASCNVGATTPEDYGNYYAWGETASKTDYSWATYKYANGAGEKLTKYCSKASYGDDGFTDDKTTLEPEDDAAHVNWGGDWRMPTATEMDELLENCIWTWTTQKGINGYQVTSKTNGNSIFLPAAGYRYDTGLYNAGSIGGYWSSSLDTNGPRYAWSGYFGSDYVYRNGRGRFLGQAVRPVCPPSANILILHIAGCEKADTIRCDAGQQITITAVPANEHRHFVRWSDGNTDNPRTIVVKSDITLTAEFALDEHTVTATAEHGTVTGSGTYTHGAEVTLTATADEHYHFVRWSDGNTDNPRTIVVESDITLTAEFALDEHTVTATAEHGTVTGSGTYTHGAEVTLTATADEHYHFVRWSDGNTDNPRTIVVESDITLTAEFALEQHIVTATAEHGTVTGSGTYTHGTEVTLIATPDEHYHFVQWSNGVTENPYTLVLTKDTILTAEFALDQHTVTATAENGIVTGSGTYTHGTEVTLTATPDEHYHFVRWSNSETENPYTLVLTKDTILTAEFALDQHTVTATAEHGIVTGSGTYTHGAEVTLIATPDIGYEFTQWSNGVTENPYTFFVTEDIALEAQFKHSTATETENTPAAETPQKIFRDGKVYILREGKVYTPTGVEVK